MATDRGFADYILEQLEGVLPVRMRKMFGEYALYHSEKVVALICDNRLYVKATKGGEAFIGTVDLAPPYPGAKMSFLIDERLEDREWLSELIRITSMELPAPKPKNKKR